MKKFIILVSLLIVNLAIAQSNWWRGNVSVAANQASVGDFFSQLGCPACKNPSELEVDVNINSSSGTVSIVLAGKEDNLQDASFPISYRLEGQLQPNGISGLLKHGGNTKQIVFQISEVEGSNDTQGIVQFYTVRYDRGGRQILEPILMGPIQKR